VPHPAIIRRPRRVTAVLLDIDPESHIPPYEQVRSQITDQATRGDLAAGTRLPPVRQLAADLGLAANTVARAYRELEQAGVVETRGRHGTFITAAACGIPLEAQQLAATFASEIRRLGFAPDQAVSLVRAALGMP
jgi:DNA-binding transcriptional regulator YhcF (GntR family)